MLKKGFLLPAGGWILSSYEAVTGTGLCSDPAPSYTEQLKACDLTSLGLSFLICGMGTQSPLCKDDSQDQAHGSVNAVCERSPATSAVNALRLWGLPPCRGWQGPCCCAHWFLVSLFRLLSYLSPFSCVLAASAFCLFLEQIKHVPPQGRKEKQVQRGLTLRGTPREDSQPCC